MKKFLIIFVVFFIVSFSLGFFHGRHTSKQVDYFLESTVPFLLLSKNNLDQYCLSYCCNDNLLYCWNIETDMFDEFNAPIVSHSKKHIIPFSLSHKAVIGVLSGGFGGWSAKDIYHHINSKPIKPKGSGKIKEIITSAVATITGYFVGYHIGLRKPLNCDNKTVLNLLELKENWEELELKTYCFYYKKIENSMSIMEKEGYILSSFNQLHNLKLKFKNEMTVDSQDFSDLFQIQSAFQIEKIKIENNEIKKSKFFPRFKETWNNIFTSQNQWFIILFVGLSGSLVYLFKRIKKNRRANKLKKEEKE